MQVGLLASLELAGYSKPDTPKTRHVWVPRHASCLVVAAAQVDDSSDIGARAMLDTRACGIR